MILVEVDVWISSEKGSKTCKTVTEGHTPRSRYDSELNPVPSYSRRRTTYPLTTVTTEEQSKYGDTGDLHTSSDEHGHCMTND